MEAAGGKGKVLETVFNVGFDKQFVPFWNGLIHLIGKIQNDVITMRYDWYNIIKECEIFEKNYLNISGFCESCVFYEMPSYLKGIMAQAESAGLYDCKEIAKDNDIIYTFCRQRQQTRRMLRWVMVILFLLLCLIVFGPSLWRKPQLAYRAFISKMKTTSTTPPVITTGR